MEERFDIRIHSRGRSREKITGDQRTVLPVFDFAGKTSPCREACPAGHDISLAMHYVKNGRFDTALRIFLEESPFPAVTGRVCYHPCEAVCNRKDHDTAIAINSVERALSEYGSAPAEPFPVQYPDDLVAVIGSGPAGVTVAYHLVRLGYPVTLFEKDEKPGGALRYGIPRYRLPEDVLDAQFTRLEAMGVKIRTGVAVGSDIPLDDIQRDFKAVFLGTGLGKSRQLPALNGVKHETGLSFLRKVNTGEITSLAGEVAVIGGGDVALDVVRSAVRMGAARVMLFCLEDRDTMPAHPNEIREAEWEGVNLNVSWAVDEIETVDGDRMRVTFNGVDALSDDLTPKLNGFFTEETVDHIVSAIGQETDADWLPEGLLTNGRISVDETGATSVPGIFAGGDGAGTYNVVQAVGAGKRAAMGIDCHLRGRDAAACLSAAKIGDNGTVSMKRYRENLADATSDDTSMPLAAVPIESINLDYFPEANRVKAPELAVFKRSGFAEVQGMYSREQAIEEAGRCFNCAECTICGNCFVYCPDSAVIQRDDGYFVIDEDHCKGCGQCVLECPRSAMSMVLRRDL